MRRLAWISALLKRSDKRNTNLQKRRLRFPQCAVIESLEDRALLSVAGQAFGARDLFDQSEYALGTFSWNVIFVQDEVLRDSNDAAHPRSGTGQVISWTQSEINNTRTRINSAANFWNDKSAAIHHENARLDIRVNFVNDAAPFTVSNANIGSESPGDLNESPPDVWAALNGGNVGDAAGNGFRAFQEINEKYRDELGTNWSFTTWVKPHTGRAWAYLTGPVNNAWVDDSWRVFAHEMGHIFGAGDEYNSSESETTDQHGYLNAFNTNAFWDVFNTQQNPNHINNRMMVNNSDTLSDGTINQIGWTDDDNDGVPNILDTIPTVDLTLNQNLDEFILRGDASVTPLPSPHPNVGDITVNWLADARWKVDDGAWNSFDAKDGVWDEYTEEIDFDLTGMLPGGNHDLVVQILNSVDNPYE